MNFGVYFVYLPTLLILFALLALQWVHAKRHGLLSPDLAPESARLIHLENLLALGLITTMVGMYLGLILLIQGFQWGRDAFAFAGFGFLPLALAARFGRRRLGLG